MNIRALCEAVKKYNYEEVRKLIQRDGVSPNDIDPQTNLRPVDIASHKSNPRMLALLVSLGANLARLPSQREKNIGNILIQAAKNYSPKEVYTWLMLPEQLLLLQDEGIKAEHIRACLNELPTDDDNLTVEDSEGLLPCYYSARTCPLNKMSHFISWIPNELKENFLNKPLEKGMYQGTTGAWWLSRSAEGIGTMLLNYPMDILTIINLDAKPINGTTRSSVMSQFLRYGVGKDLLADYPNEIFFNINWNMPVNNKGTTAAWKMVFLSRHCVRLFELPPENLAKIDWNAAPISGRSKGVTVASRMTGLDTGEKLLCSLSAEILNTITWNTTPNLINKIAKKWKKTNKNLTILLDKLSLETLDTIYDSLEKNDPAFPFVAIEIIKKLNASISDETIMSNSDKNIENWLEQFSILFSELELIKKNIPHFQKEINGLKGQIIYRMSLTENTANQLLSMANPFFKTLIYDLNSIDKVKLIAQQYLMRGKEPDRIQGSFVTLFYQQNMDRNRDLGEKQDRVMHRNDDNNNKNILDLPEEVQVKILSFLNKRELVLAGRTCEGLYRLSKDPFLQKKAAYAPLDYTKMLSEKTAVLSHEDATYLTSLAILPNGFIASSFRAAIQGWRGNLRRHSRGEAMVCIWDPQKNVPAHTFQPHNYSVDNINVLNGNLVMITDQYLGIWDLATNKWLNQFKLPDYHGVYHIAVLPNNLIAYGSTQADHILIFDPYKENAERPILTFGENTNGRGIYTLKATSDGKIITNGGIDYQFKVYDSETGSCIKTFNGNNSFSPCKLRTIYSATQMMGSTQNNEIYIWDYNTDQINKSPEKLKGTIWSLRLLPTGQIASLGRIEPDSSLTRGKEIRIWEANTLRCLQTFKVSDDARYLEVLADGKLVIAGERGGLQILSFACLKPELMPNLVPDFEVDISSPSLRRM